MVSQSEFVRQQAVDERHNMVSVAAVDGVQLSTDTRAALEGYIITCNTNYIWLIGAI